MNWLKRLFHECLLPERLPVVEDQRLWHCPECNEIWRWTELEEGLGWAKFRIGATSA